jgi:holo-[acyl-carrier protein] synthase
MSILRNGVDVLEIERLRMAVERFGDRFLKRVFTLTELTENRGKIESLAVRFAAKEATAKALGTGIGEVGWLEIEILRGNNLEPILVLHGKAHRLAQKLHLSHWAISLSHTRSLAVAFVVASSGTIE